ncbi:MAG: bleomycin resistance protein [Herpetosiphonaceae bacterium]|nr:MAG: bleomycin resistance protein [Herpetosiphonaceae bacterium]
MATNRIVQVEWLSTDLSRSSAFFHELFGWDFQPFGADYLYYKHPDGGAGAGIQRSDHVRPGNTPVAYIHVDNIEDCLVRVQELGGRVVVPRTEVPDAGWFAHFADPDGNVIGLVE